MAEDSVPAVRVRGEGRPAREAAAAGRRACVLLGRAGRRAVTQPAESWARATPQTTVQPRSGFRFPGFGAKVAPPPPRPGRAWSGWEPLELPRISLQVTS